MSCTNILTDPCGCQLQLDTKCIFYNSDTLSCLDVQSNTDLETILKKIDEIICDLNPTDPIVYTVRNLDGTITVTPTGTNPKVFTVSISSSVLNRISTLESKVSDIEDFIADLAFSTTTSGLTGSWTGSTLTVNYTPPASLVTGGIIYNNFDEDVVAINTATDPVKSFTSDLIADYDLQIGEVIKLKGTFELSSRVDGSLGTDSEFSVDVNGVYKLSNILYQNSDLRTVFSYDYEIDITVVDTDNVAKNAVINGKLRRTTGANDWYNPNSQVATSVLEVACSISYYTQIDWENFEVTTAITNNSANDTAKNNQLYIELIKLK
jgi:hypothetical protein